MSSSTALRVRRLFAVPLLVTILALTGAPPAVAAPPKSPDSDSFYVYSGAKPLGQISGGTVLKRRAIQVKIAGYPTPFDAVQALYRTTNQLGAPSATVTTVIKPLVPNPVVNLVSYQTAYDALGTQCDPSYTLNGGNPGYQLAQDEAAFIATYLTTGGYYVNVPDYEGTRRNGEPLHWAAGYESGYGTLDSVKAAESVLKAPSSTKVGLVGYSGGSIASEWASELAGHYAPQLNIVGVAEAGIPVHFAHNLKYINGSPVWSGIIPAVIVALSQSFGIDYAKYLSPFGLQVTTAIRNQCITDFLGKYPGLTTQKILKPQYRDFLAIPAFRAVVNKLIMGTVPGHPKGPLFMMNGNADGTGDNVMIAADVRALALQYCAQGVNVNYKEIKNQQGTHTNVAAIFEPAGLTFLTSAFAGTPPPSGCATIAKGSSLAPVSAPSSTGSSGSGPTGSGNTGSGSTGSGATGTTGTPGSSGNAAGSGALAATGVKTSHLALIGLALLALGLVITFAAARPASARVRVRSRG